MQLNCAAGTCSSTVLLTPASNLCSVHATAIRKCRFSIPSNLPCTDLWITLQPARSCASTCHAKTCERTCHAQTCERTCHAQTSERTWLLSRTDLFTNLHWFMHAPVTHRHVTPSSPSLVAASEALCQQQYSISLNIATCPSTPRAVRLTSVKTRADLR